MRIANMQAQIIKVIKLCGCIILYTFKREYVGGL